MEKFENFCVSYNNDLCNTEVKLNRSTNQDLNYWWNDNYTNIYHWYYPTTTQIIVTEDKFSKAFKIAKSLMDKKLVLVKEMKIKEFCDLIDCIAKEL